MQFTNTILHNISWNITQARPMSVSYVPRSLQSWVSTTHRSYSQVTFFNIFIKWNTLVFPSTTVVSPHKWKILVGPLTHVASIPAQYLDGKLQYSYISLNVLITQSKHRPHPGGGPCTCTMLLCCCTLLLAVLAATTVVLLHYYSFSCSCCA